MSSPSYIRRTRTLAIGLVLALALAACGTDAVDEPAAPPDTAPEAEPEEPADSPEDPQAGETPTDESPEEAPDPVAGDCSAAGAQITPVDTVELPADVVALRDFLLDAALRCDEQLLHTATEESSMFTYSFGEEGDAIGYWWDLEEAGQQPFLRLAQVLGTTPALADGGDIVVWPQVQTGRDENTTDEAWAELTWMTDEERVASQGETGYLGWRVGISTDGEWRFFVSGD
ncbi:MAG: hypothetical protein WD011_07910 [Nitriliruptoraceae bacterium]